MEIFDRVRFARDRALSAEQEERQRLADAGTLELQQAASVRLATRQAVREALDDILDETSEPEKAARSGTGGTGGTGGTDAGGTDAEREPTD